MKHAVYFILLVISTTALSQENLSDLNRVTSFHTRFLEKLRVQSSELEEKIADNTQKALQKLAREETRLKKKLARKDSIAADGIFEDPASKYGHFRELLAKPDSNLNSFTNLYSPRLDSLRTALNFLQAGKLIGNKSSQLYSLQESLNGLDKLQGKLNQTELIRKYVKERRQYLQEQLRQFNFSRPIQKWSKQADYYQLQLNEYKRIVEEPSRLETRLMEELRKSSLFQKFFNKHADLAALFRLPGNSEGIDPTALIPGLQTRTLVDQQLTQQLGAGPNVNQIVQGSIQSAEGQLNELKNKLNSLGGGNGDLEMPTEKLNTQRTKSFLSRFELGFNAQSQRANSLLPTQTDLGFSLGYKLSDKSMAGIGSSLKVGWGKDIRHIVISGEGLSLRSFFDWKVKGGWWLSSAGELNYYSSFRSVNALQNPTPWQQSLLAGLKKKYQIKKYKGNISL